MDLHVDVEQPDAAAMSAGPGEPSASVRERVLAAREIQARRLGGRANAEMHESELRSHVAIAPQHASLLESARAAMGLSGRGHDRVLRVARTIADLDGRDDVAADDLAQALSYRSRGGD